MNKIKSRWYTPDTSTLTGHTYSSVLCFAISNVIVIYVQAGLPILFLSVEAIRIVPYRSIISLCVYLGICNTHLITGMDDAFKTGYYKITQHIYRTFSRRKRIFSIAFINASQVSIRMWTTLSLQNRVTIVAVPHFYGMRCHVYANCVLFWYFVSPCRK